MVTRPHGAHDPDQSSAKRNRRREIRKIRALDLHTVFGRDFLKNFVLLFREAELS
jgi:hypothetical protein